MSFERILFRATGGNVYLKQAVVGHPVIDPVSGEKKADKRKKIHAFKRQNAWQQFQTTKGRAKKGTRIDNAPLNGNDFRSNNDEDEDKDVDRYSLH
ncbi:hypothetical protein AgCh_018698 [Apium graveolens]